MPRDCERTERRLCRKQQTNELNADFSFYYEAAARAVYLYLAADNPGEVYEGTVAGVALTLDVYESGWHAFEENTHPCCNQTEMEQSVAAIDLAPAAVYYDA